MTPNNTNGKVGYGNPPLHSRFRKGQSGNPSGRRRGSPPQTIDLLLKEAYRPLRLKQGDSVVVVPAMQALIRSTMSLAIKGNGPALRLLLSMIPTFEQEKAKHDAKVLEHASDEQQLYSPLELARRIAFSLELGRRELLRRQAELQQASPSQQDAVKANAEGVRPATDTAVSRLADKPDKS